MKFVHRRRLVIAIISGGTILLVLIGLGVYGLFRGPASAGPPSEPAAEASAASTPTSSPGQPEPVLMTTDPELFTRSVASALFTWDTRNLAGLSEWAQVLVGVADASEAPALASDVRGYFPDPQMWEQLSTYGTRQWLDIESVTVPDAWATAQQQASPGQIPRGAEAFTVVGTSHRAGTWDTQDLQTDRQVAFTVFIVCPAGKPCSLLRLSQLDHPLK